MKQTNTFNNHLRYKQKKVHIILSTYEIFIRLQTFQVIIFIYLDILNICDQANILQVVSEFSSYICCAKNLNHKNHYSRLSSSGTNIV